MKKLEEGTYMNRTDAEWKKILSPEEYRILRKKGTERPFQGEYDNRRYMALHLHIQVHSL